MVWSTNYVRNILKLIYNDIIYKMNLLTIITVLGIIVIVFFLGYIILDIRKIIKNQTGAELADMEANRCPDFFISSGDKCINKYKLGDGSNFNPEEDQYTDPVKGNEEKCLWARRKKVSWDGIDRLC